MILSPEAFFSQAACKTLLAPSFEDQSPLSTEYFRLVMLANFIMKTRDYFP